MRKAVKVKQDFNDLAAFGMIGAPFGATLNVRSGALFLFQVVGFRLVQLLGDG